MTVAIKNNNKTPLVVPASVRRAAGFKSGQEVEFKASCGVITILPKLQSSEDEHTPAQRRRLDAQLAAAEKGPFTVLSRVPTGYRVREKRTEETERLE
jgi:bifunctional DNA-binding transcriptional regulator/antitoxin component of YhaV-PrlF toxin-antitoxin module